VFPGTVADNARFLAGRVAEAGLCCFEAEASALTPEAEMPAGLAELPLRWHVHLPVDISPDNGAEAARTVLRVWKRAAFLRPWLGVLHWPAPSGGEVWLRDFLRAWRMAGCSPESLALENTRDACADDYEDILEELGVGVCLDVGHIMAYGQRAAPGGFASPPPSWMDRVRLVHWSAPGGAGSSGSPADMHLPLTSWTPEQRVAAGKIARCLPLGAVHMIEVFRWRAVEQSWPVLKETLAAE
jgi:hypothetical protein